MSFMNYSNILVFLSIALITPAVLKFQKEKDNWVYCDGVLNKPPGRIRDSSGTIIPFEKPKLMIQNSTAKGCGLFCFNLTWCRMSEFVVVGDASNYAECRLFQRKQYYHKSLPGNAIHYWKLCNLSDSQMCYRHSYERCKGIFVRYPQSRLILPIPPLENNSNALIQNSALRCLENHVCGSVNFNNTIAGTGYTELISNWPKLSAKYIKYDPKFQIFHWKCCDLDDPPQNKCMQYENRYGYWKVDAPTTPNRNAEYCFNYFTMSAKSCRDECAKQPNQRCRRPWYNLEYSKCLLEADPMTSCARTDMLLPEYNFTSYKWIECPNPKQRQTAPIKGKNQEFSGCVCIVDPEKVTVLENHCSRPDENTSEREVYSGMAFFTNGETRKNWIKVFSGIDFLWIFTKSSTALNRNCSMEQCRLYSGAIDPNYPLKIHSRSQWGARPKRQLDTFSATPKFVIIGEVQIPFCGCFTRDACSSACRRRQNYQMDILGYGDIAEHFIIGSDGYVYEGRSVEYVPAVARSSNFISLGVSFIGNFETQSPTLKALNAARLVLQKMVNDKKLDKNYRLVANRNVMPSSKDPGMKLYTILHNWNHFKGRMSRSLFCFHVFLIHFILFLLSIGFYFVAVPLILAFFLRRRDYFHSTNCGIVRKTLKSLPTVNRLIHTVPIYNIDSDILVRESEENKTICRIKIHRNLIGLTLDLTKDDIIVLTPRSKCNCLCRLLINQLVSITKERSQHNFLFELCRTYFLRTCANVTCAISLHSDNRLDKTRVYICHLADVKDLLELVRAFGNVKGPSTKLCLCEKYRMDSSQWLESRCIPRQTLSGRIQDQEKKSFVSMLTQQREYFERVSVNAGDPISYKSYLKGAHLWNPIAPEPSHFSEDAGDTEPLISIEDS